MNTQLLTVIVLVFFGLAVLLLAGMYSLRRRRAERQAWSPPADRGLRRISQERIASPVSEVIEDMVRARMASDPDLKGITLDFGTSDDGGLEIWLGDECYQGVDALPNSRLKGHIAAAVAEYNRDLESGEG